MDALTLGERTPRIGPADAALALRRLWGLEGEISTLPGERDRNFVLARPDGARWVLKVSRLGEDRALLEAQNAMVHRLAERARPFLFPLVVPSLAGLEIETLEAGDARHLARVVRWIPGRPLARLDRRPPSLLREVGRLLGTVDRALDGLELTALRRDFYWDVRGGPALVAEHAAALPPDRRALLLRRVEAAGEALSSRLERLRIGLLHGDGNDWNVLVTASDRPEESAEPDRVSGLLDFGDAVYSWLPAEAAVGAAYAMMGQPDPVAAAAAVVAGYQASNPLTRPELEVVWALAGLRLAMSVTIAALQHGQRPDDAYLSVSEAAAWSLLEAMDVIHPALATERIMESADSADTPDILQRRRRHIGPSLSVSYRRPLHIVRGWMQHLYDADGAEYLDCVNNVAHVGHSHPRVVEALSTQAAVLNTNTRYLHENLVRYAEQLAATLPDPLSVCFFVNSGSEANELALRLARAFTGRRDAVVLDAAYHGNTNAAIELSPYKFDGPAGGGAPPWVHVAPLPDPYRGLHRAPHPRLGDAYAADVAAAVERAEASGGIAAFFAESLASCGGQIEYPAGFLPAAYAAVRAAGGVCVADEVQVGFGRVGSHFWGFQTQGDDVVPDIVTLGKPIGNGHPLGAVVTTAAIAAAFDRGMEYFNTFGGNPVSCAVGLAVLDVIHDDGLQEHAAHVGERFLTDLRRLAADHPAIGDVRGRGLFLGVEIVVDPERRTPDARLAADVVEAMRDRGILLSTDGPDANVIKIKPPLPFTAADAERVASALDEVVTRLSR